MERAVPALARRGGRRDGARRLDGGRGPQRRVPARASCGATTAGCCGRGRAGAPTRRARVRRGLRRAARGAAHARRGRRRRMARRGAHASPTTSCACSPTRSTAGSSRPGTDAEALIVRPKDVQDNATPVGELARRQRAAPARRAHRGRDATRSSRRAGSAALAPLLGEHPTAFAYLLGALERLVAPPIEVAIVGDGRRRRDPAAARARSSGRLSRPNVVVTLAPARPGTGRRALAAARGPPAGRRRRAARVRLRALRVPAAGHDARGARRAARRRPGGPARLRQAPGPPSRARGTGAGRRLVLLGGAAEAVGELLGHRPAVGDERLTLGGVERRRRGRSRPCRRASRDGVSSTGSTPAPFLTLKLRSS